MSYNKYIFLICSFFLFQTCEEEEYITFSEVNITTKNNSLVDINIPKASGNSAKSEEINNELSHIIAKELQIGDSDNATSNSIEESINSFNKEYHSFITDFPESNQIWEAQIDGDVIFQSEEIITISLTSYINTGGAHGILTITITNFDALTGKRIPNTDLTNNPERFKNIAKTFFDNTIKDKSTLFKPENFSLPANIGYTQDGILFIYNTYEIAPYSSGLIEFTVPFKDIDSYLVFNSSI